VAPFFVVAAWVVAVAIQIVLLPVTIAAVVVAGFGYTAVVAVSQAWRVLSVGTLAGPSSVATPPSASAVAGASAAIAGAGAEPAYPAYFLRQAWIDVWVVTRRSARQTLLRGRDLYLRGWEYLGNNGPVTLFVWPSVIGAVLGTVLLAVPVLVALLVLAVLQAVAVAVTALGWIVLVGVLGSVEVVLRGLRRIVVACPHPGCYQRFGLPVYVCSSPGCGERHRRLVPNRYGALRHTCRCGARLPTLVLLGRHRLPAYCPHCAMPLPGRTGRVRIEHVPIVGGPDAGKSTFLCLSVSALAGALAARGGSLSFVDARDERAMTDGLAQLRRGDRLVKTGVVLPRAVMVDVRPKAGKGRILYMFDPAGEYYAGRDIDSQRYLDHSEVALVVVDPLAIPDVWTAFTDADRAVIAEAAPSNQAEAVREKAGDVVDRLVNALRGRPAGNRLTRLLVVVSKSDVMRRTSVGASLGTSAPSVEAWLEHVGWGNWVRTLRDHADSIAFSASALDAPNSWFAGALGWVSGVDLSGKTGRPIAARHPPRPWPSASRPGLVPRGHRLGRIAVLALVVLAELGLGAGTIWYALHTLHGIYT
jgi:hypothetical protein